MVRGFFVAPLAGAWIEIFDVWNMLSAKPVAPLAGAWIEILCYGVLIALIRSLPSRERGLKCYTEWTLMNVKKVAPLAGAWIEISICMRFSG